MRARQDPQPVQPANGRPPGSGEEKARRVALVVNSLSGQGSADMGAIVRRMTDGGIDILSVDATDDPAEIMHLARRAAEIADIVVIGGGDGTVSSTLPVFMETNRTLGVLPLGTANDLARSLAIPLDPLDAADVLVTGQVRRIDLGEVNGRPFCNAVSVGFSAEVAVAEVRERKKWLGALEYPLSWMKAAREFEPFAVTLEHDAGGRRFDSVFMLTVMNGRYHGRGMSVDEQAQIDDGLLKIYCVEFVSRWKLLLVFLSLQRGRLRRDGHTSLLRARHVEISGRRPMPLDVDGDVLAETPATIRVLPAAISVMVPRPDPASDKA